MAETVGVVIATFGDQSVWGPLAQRAERSAKAQTRQPDRIFNIQGLDLASARNMARHLPVDWLIFLDADDELDAHYIEAMLAGDGDIRQPATIGVYPDGTTDPAPSVIPARDIRTGNYVVIGAMCRRDHFDQVGGFRDLPFWEDWDLWLRMVTQCGAVIQPVPEAIYRIHVNPDSRNAIDPRDERVRGVYRDIRRYSNV